MTDQTPTHCSRDLDRREIVISRLLHSLGKKTDDKINSGIHVNSDYKSNYYHATSFFLTNVLLYNVPKFKVERVNMTNRSPFALIHAPATTYGKCMGMCSRMCSPLCNPQGIILRFTFANTQHTNPCISFAKGTVPNIHT